jgi:hypothetical protein
VEGIFPMRTLNRSDHELDHDLSATKLRAKSSVQERTRPQQANRERAETMFARALRRNARLGAAVLSAPLAGLALASSPARAEQRVYVSG